jgi:acetylglutamate kinase
MERVFVIKIGGNIIDQPEVLNSFLDDFADITDKKILIHGGGKLATEVAKALGIETKMIEGRRITDEKTLKVVTMVYGGRINKTIVSGLQARGCNAFGLTGADGNLIVATKRRHPSIDFGFVGDIARVNEKALTQFLHAGISPVFAALTHDGKGNLLNTNADTIATALARALLPHYHTTLIYCFDKKGVLASTEDQTVIPRLTLEQYLQLKVQGIVSAGMIPKLEEAFAALQAGAVSVVLCHAADLRLVLSEQEAGTRLI